MTRERETCLLSEHWNLRYHSWVLVVTHSLESISWPEIFHLQGRQLVTSSIDLCLKGLQPEHCLIVFFGVKIQLLWVHVACFLISPVGEAMSITLDNYLI